jgi:hypothetical protein
MLCVFCQQRKGKRACPALTGLICSQCCGQHRLQAIHCPSDCVFLGGLKTLSDPAAPQQLATHDSFTTALKKLVRFMEQQRPLLETALRALGTVPQASWVEPMAVAHACYGYRDAQGHRILDHFLLRHGRDLAPAEAAALVCLQQARLSLLSVEAVHQGAGLELFDLLNEAHYRVREISASFGLRRGDVVCGWLVELHDHFEMTGAAVHVPAPHKDHMLSVLRRVRNEAQQEHPDLPANQLLNPHTGVILRALQEAIAATPTPQLATADGKDLVFCKAHFRLFDGDEASVRRRLSTRKDIESDGDVLVWLGGRGQMGVGRTVLGRITLEPGGLILETLSRERLERGKQMLTTRLPGVLRHVMDTLKDPAQAMAEIPREAHRGPTPPAPAEQAVMAEALRAYYARWPDTPVPALSGKTPRQAVKTRAGKRKVEQLLCEIEKSTLAMPGGEAMDFSGIREQLELVEAADGQYDAERAPDPATWLSLDESERLAAIEKAHRQAAATHPAMPNRRLHALIHLVVENQLAAGEPAEVKKTLRRLMDQGLSRHAALHALGSVVSGWMFDTLKKQQPIDLQRSLSDLDRLQAQDWSFAR